MLQVDNLNVFYGGIQALENVNVRVDQGTLVTIIGSNGAGKSTLIRTLAGLVKQQSGSIEFDGSRLDSNPPHRRVEMGIALVPEGRHVFPQFTVLENLMMGAYGRKDRKQALKEGLSTIYELFPILHERKQQYGGTLSGGEQQMLAIGRALMAQPKLLMLDEPSMGLSPIYQRAVRDILAELKQKEMTILLVEQNAALALGVADYVYLIEVGKVIEHGPVQEMRCSKRVQQAYLGG